MILEFESVYVERFKSVYSSILLDLHRPPALYFMTGRNEVETRLGANGTGKTTVLIDAVFWVFFGVTSRGVGAGNVNSWGGVTCTVGEVQFKVNGESYTLRRTWHPNTLVWVEDGSYIGTTQEEVEDLIKFNSHTLAHSVILGQFSKLFFDLRPMEKENLISDVLSLSSWTDRSKKVSGIVDELVRSIDILNNDQARLEGQLYQITEENYEREIKDWEEGRLAGIEKAEEEFSTTSSRVKSREKDIGICRKDITKIRDHSDDVSVDLMEEKAEESELAQRLAAVITEGKVKQKEILIALRTIKDLEGTKGRCILCDQEITEEHRIKELKNVDRYVGELEADSRILDKKERSIEKAFEMVRGKIQVFEKERRGYLSEIARLERDSIRMQGAVDEIRREVVKKKEYLTELREESNPFVFRREKSEQQALVLSEKIGEVSGRRLSMERELRLTEFWIKGFKEVRRFVISKALEELELEVNTSLMQLGLVDWRISLDVEKETKSGGVSKGFHVMIYSPDNDLPVPWEAWSGGETQRLRLAGTLGMRSLILNRLGIKVNLLAWDEPSNWLSKEGIDDLLDTLYFLAADDGIQVWLIDHRALDYGHFADTITVVRDKEGTYLD